MAKQKTGKDLEAFAQAIADEAHAKAEATRISAEAKVRQGKLTQRALEKDRDELLTQFMDLRNSKYPKPVKHPTKPEKRSGDYVRVIIPDVHAATMDRGAVDAFFRDLKHICPDEIVLMGDLLEAGGFLAGHQTLGYIAQTEYNFQDDVIAANWFLDQMALCAPKARVHFVEGNHDDRMERWIVDQTQRHTRDSKFLRELLGPEAILRLNERGIAYYRRGESYMGIDQPGMIKLGKIFFVHELSGAKNAAMATLGAMAANVNYAHTHRADTASLVLPGVGTVQAWNAGCLTKRQPLWRHSQPTNWSHGYAIEFIASDESFLHVQVPIIDGKSLFSNLLTHLK